MSSGQNILTEITHQKNSASQMNKLKCITVYKFLHLMEKKSCLGYFYCYESFSHSLCILLDANECFQESANHCHLMANFKTLMAHTIARLLLVLQEVEKIVQVIIVHRLYLMKEFMAKENDEVCLWLCPLV